LSYRSTPEVITKINDSAAPIDAWSARLELRFARRGDITAAVHRNHRGPLRVQRMLYPEGVRCCHALLLHPPGGIAGGDRLEIDVQMETGANALLTTPGAAKWYRTGDASAAQQYLKLTVDDDACLEWLPQESILFDGAQVIQHAEINLAPRAAMFGWDIVQLGRLAAGERWQRGFWQQRLALLRGDRVVWLEQAQLSANDPLRDSALRLAGHDVFATAWACSPRLSADHAHALDAARAAAARFDLPCGITWLAAPAELLVVRALGASGHPVRELFEALWHTLRPWTSAMPPQRPRIWST
jgi:urease accessory protein